MSQQLHPEAPNFRSFCGMELPDGRRVRQGRFYRCASPHTFSPAALATLEALDPYAVIDLRGEAESAAAAYALPGAIRDRRVALPVEPKTGERVRALHAQGKLTPDAAREAMRETYRYYARDNAETFARLLRLAAESGGRPIVWHCAAGKDRTGFAGALILAALGAAQAAIEADYLRSNDLWKPHRTDGFTELPEEAVLAMRRVEADYLQAGIEALNATWGSPAAFAAAALGGEAAHARFVAEALEEA